MNFERYSDTRREEKERIVPENKYSTYCDLIYYSSSQTPDTLLAMKVHKPAGKGRLVLTTHGWHMSIPRYQPKEDAPLSDDLYVEVDMRGRAFSQGTPDCNGYELYDIIDAAEYVILEGSRCCHHRNSWCIVLTRSRSSLALSA